MAVIIGTATSILGLFGADPYGTSMDGFTSGNLAGGIQPTQLSADWFNSCQQEINNACINGLGFALDATDYTQLAYSIDAQNVDQRPRAQTGVTYTFRSQADSEVSTAGKDCVVRSRTTHNPSLAAGSTASVCILPTTTNSQMFVVFRASVVQTDLATNYANVEWKASVRNSGGVVTVQTSAASFNDNPVGHTFSVIATGSNVALRMAAPAIPAGKFHNCLAHGVMTIVRMTP